MNRHVVAALAACVIVGAAFSAAALDLKTARARGLVTEKSDGYIAAEQNTAEVATLVRTVNAKRRAEYERISVANGQSVEVVGKLAAPEIAKNMATGN